jgi:cell division septation protein DedD
MRARQITAFAPFPMAQDFAKQRSNPDAGKRKRAATRSAPPGNASWSWFFSGLMTGIIVSIAAYLAVLKLEEGVSEDAQVVQAGVKPEDEPTYSFYETLSNAEVTVNTPEALSPAASAPNATPNTASNTVAATEEKSTRYLLQAGSFENKQGAESRRTSIILLNMNANLVEGVVGGRTLYSVQVGPFAGRQGAEDARGVLTSNNIESIPMLAPQ